LHRDSDENISAKRILLNLDSPNVFLYFTKNETLEASFYTKNMAPMSHKLHVSI